MSVPLTIGSFLLGYRTSAARSIPHNPFYNPWADRASAEDYVRRCGYPLLRDSSRRGLFAITYVCRVDRRILHTLLRQNADLTIDCLTDDGLICQHFVDIYELLEGVVWPRVTPLVEVAPALIPMLPAAIRHMTADEDPC
jgi:hypothetical protein